MSLAKMSTVTESDLKELKDLINQRFNELDRKIDSLEKKIDVYMAKTDEQLKGIEKRHIILILSLFVAGRVETSTP